MAWLYAFGLLMLGFALVLLEIFVIPGVNIFGVIGFIAVCVSVGYAYAELGTWPAAGAAGLALVGTLVMVRVLARVHAWQRLVLSSDNSRAGGYDSVVPGREKLLGQRGEAVSPLRPAGRALFGESVVDVITEGGFIGPGETVQVLRVVGSKVVVHRPVDGPAATPVGL